MGFSGFVILCDALQIFSEIYESRYKVHTYSDQKDSSFLKVIVKEIRDSFSSEGISIYYFSWLLSSLDCLVTILKTLICLPNGAKILNLSKKNHIQKISLFTKLTISKSHFSQNSHFQNLIFHNIHNFYDTFFSKNQIFKD